MRQAAADADAFDRGADELALVGDQHDLVGVLDRQEGHEVVGLGIRHRLVGHNFAGSGRREQRPGNRAGAYAAGTVPRGPNPITCIILIRQPIEEVIRSPLSPPDYEATIR